MLLGTVLATLWRGLAIANCGCFVLVLNGSSSPTFHHSFQTTALISEEDGDDQVLRGPVKIHRENFLSIARLDLRIPENGDLTARYVLYRMTNFGRETVAVLTFTLSKSSDFFRTVELEVDQVEGVPLPTAFQPGTLPDTPADVPPQPIDFQSAYRAAGLDLNVTLGGQDVGVNLAGPDGRWSDEELHAAMVQHFTEHADVAQWRLYLLLATRYQSPSVLGIMFDSGDDFPRQGVAVFADHPSLSNGQGPEVDREYLFTIVHELGHAFNFLHAFQKGIFSTHGVLPRPDSLSWRNYPQLFPFGNARPPGWDGSGRLGTVLVAVSFSV